MQIVVITGGDTAERGVAIASASQVFPALRSCGHIVEVFDTHLGMVDTLQEDAHFAAGVEALSSHPAASGVPRDSTPLAELAAQLSTRFDVAFLALHGGTGENGHIQAVLEKLNLPYTRSGVLGCAVMMDKDMSKRVF